MYGILILIWGIFGALFWLARREEADEEIASLLKPFYKIALFLYKKGVLRIPGLLAGEGVEQDLNRLYPGEVPGVLKTRYYVKKLALSLAVILVGISLGAVARWSARATIMLDEAGGLMRGDYSEGVREVAVTARYGQEKLDFLLHVNPRRLSEEEAELLFAEICGNLPEYILGENESLEAVTVDLVLEESYEELPVVFRWESDSPDILSRTGRVGTVEAARQVRLTVCMSYGEWSRTEELVVTVVPPLLTKSEMLYREMEEMLLLSEGEAACEERWQLPAEWRGKAIDWEQSVEDNSFLICVAALAVAGILYFCADRDLHERVEERRRSLKREYPEIVHKLVLFVGTGMTIRGAFCKIAGDYEKKRNGEKSLPAYEEMLYTCRELRAGVSEGAAYEHFGKRTGVTEYIRLSSLLSQNLKRGNRTLLERLREEADKAAEEQLQQCKKLGEEAGTKLLVPMVLLLAVVMVIIMIPAFSNM